MKYIALRYFCAAGATESNGESRKSRETHLIPLIVDKIISHERTLSVFGNDFHTRDGSGIRDYVHVKDIAAAHIVALENIDRFPNSIYNIGTNYGYSVFEVINEAESNFGISIDYRLSKRRPGDPANLTSSYKKINQELGWEPKFSLKQMLLSTMEWRKNPKY